MVGVIDAPQWLLPAYVRSVKAVGATAPVEQIRSAGTALIEMWGSPDRCFHNLRHAIDMLARVDELADESHNPDVMRLAVWYHGCVFSSAQEQTYKRNGGEDEIASAAFAAEDLQALGVPDAVVDRIRALILNLKRHNLAANDIDALALNDADLGTLAVEPQLYKRYRELVRAEYAHIPAVDYLRARLTIISKLLGRETLFSSPLGARWELPARQNLQAEKRRLEDELAQLTGSTSVEDAPARPVTGADGAAPAAAAGTGAAPGGAAGQAGAAGQVGAAGTGGSAGAGSSAAGAGAPVPAPETSAATAATASLATAADTAGSAGTGGTAPASAQVATQRPEGDTVPPREPGTTAGTAGGTAQAQPTPAPAPRTAPAEEARRATPMDTSRTPASDTSPATPSHGIPATTRAATSGIPIVQSGVPRPVAGDDIEHTTSMESCAADIDRLLATPRVVDGAEAAAAPTDRASIAQAEREKLARRLKEKSETAKVLREARTGELTPISAEIVEDAAAEARRAAESGDLGQADEA